MDCGGDGTEWDIWNEFETVDGMPVYYGGDLCDSDDLEDSEWEDHWNLAYAEHVDQYNFDALDGIELKVYERLQAVNEPVMMVGELPCPELVHQNLNGSLVEVDMVGSATKVNILTEMK